MKNILKICKKMTFACFLVIISLEVVLRIVRKEQWVKHEYPKVYALDTIYGYKGIPNIEGYIRRPSISKRFKLNNHGFYGADFTAEKQNDVYRIIIVGSSGVEGIWANHKEAFPMKLQKLFKQKGIKLEVINCAVSGNDRDFQNINLIKHDLLRYHPDLVLYEAQTQISSGNHHRDSYKDYSILFAGDNMKEKTHSKYLAEREVDRIKQHKLFTDLWEMSYLLRFYVRKANIRKIPSLANCLQIYVDNEGASWNYSHFKKYTFTESVDILNQLNQILKTHSCKFVLFDYSLGNEEGTMNIKEEIKFPHIFLNISGKNLSHKYDGHFNENAHQIIAEELFAKLSKDFIPKEFISRKLNFGD